MIWLGERLIDLGMWFRRDPVNVWIFFFYAIGIAFLAMPIVIPFIRT